MTLFDFAAKERLRKAREARDKAMERVETNAKPWLHQALEIMPLCPFEEATGEDLRLWVCGQIGRPHHHNAAGALVRQALRKGIIEKTGRWDQMKSRKSHARMTPVYRVARSEKGGAK